MDAHRLSGQGGKWMVPLDLKGNITVILSALTLYILVLGLPLFRKPKNERKLIMHGYFSIVALAIQTALFAVVMVPSFEINLDRILDLTSGYALNTWLHFAFGASALISGFAYVGLWFIFKTARMRCARAKKYMMVTLYVWISAIVTGALIHVLQMF